MNEIDFKELKEFDNHKLVIKIEDKEAGLKGFIAIHNNNLGSPAVGGTRMLPYDSEKDALIDVLRLSRAMTYKCAIARVSYGGAKGVIIGDPKKDKTEKLLEAYAQKINKLKGAFYTGEDVGMTERDIQTMLKHSNYFNGSPELAGDPSPYASLGTFYSIQKAIGFIYKKDSLEGIKVAIKGVGKVGKALVGLLSDANANIFISDIDPLAIKETKKRFPNVTVVDNATVQSLEVDVYSPCALGNDFSMENVNKIKAKIICGGANNQLVDQKVGDWFFNHNIIYVPDYVANAGGLINVVDELEKDGYHRSRVLERIYNIKNVVAEILSISKKMKQPPYRISDQIAEKYFKS